MHQGEIDGRALAVMTARCQLSLLWACSNLPVRPDSLIDQIYSCHWLPCPGSPLPLSPVSNARVLRGVRSGLVINTVSVENHLSSKGKAMEA